MAGERGYGGYENKGGFDRRIDYRNRYGDRPYTGGYLDRD